MSIMLNLLAMITAEPFFNQLRTKEEMCYSLGIFQSSFNNIGGYMLHINTQENKFSADFVEKRVEKFHLSVRSIVNQLSQVEYEQFRQALINQNRQANLSLRDEFVNNWTEIESQEYFFNYTELIISTLAVIEKKDLLEFMELYMNTNMRKLSVQVIGSSHPRRSEPDVKDSSTPAPVSDEEHLFQPIWDEVKLQFIGDPRNPSHIMNIAEFKNNLYVYPRIFINPKKNTQEASLLFSH